MAAPADDRRRPDEKGPAPGKVDPAAADKAANDTWGGEGGAGAGRSGPTTSPGDAAKDPGGNPEVM